MRVCFCNSILRVGIWFYLFLNCLNLTFSESLILILKEIMYDDKRDVFIEFCSFREFRRFFTEFSVLSFGLFMCSLLGCEEGGELGILSRFEF